MRQIAERHEESYSYRIYREDREELFTVMFYFRGVHIAWMNYYTNNETDARAEGKKQILRFLLKDMKKGA